MGGTNSNPMSHPVTAPQIGTTEEGNLPLAGNIGTPLTQMPTAASKTPNPYLSGLFNGMKGMGSGESPMNTGQQGGTAGQISMNLNPMGTPQAPSTGFYPRTSMIRRGFTQG